MLRCTWCETAYLAHPYKAKRDRNFCSRVCVNAWRGSGVFARERNPAWKGGHDWWRGSNWEQQSRLARERDGDACQSCGLLAAGHDVHHKVPFRLFTDYREANVLDNLVTLCPTCHGKAEAAYGAEHPEVKAGWRTLRVGSQRLCTKCGATFSPRGPRTQWCDDCHTVTCAYCGRRFFNKRALDRAVRYCSNTCHRASRTAAGWRSLVKECPGCGAAFTAEHLEARYCSQRCHLTRANPRRAFSERRRLAAQASGQTEA